MEKVKVKVDAYGEVTELTADGVFLCSYTEKDDEGDGNIFITGNFKAPYIHHVIIEGMFESIDQAVTSKQMSVVKGIEILADLEGEFNEHKDELLDNWAKMAAKDPTFSAKAVIDEALDRLKEMMDCVEGGETS